MLKGALKLVFATNNLHKLKEVEQLLPPNVHLISLREIDGTDDLPETGVHLEDNARQKARYIHDKFGLDCFADDTGLEVEALDGRPGVYSARYAGPACNSEENIRKVLTEMNGIQNRKAKFRTVIALYINQQEFLFEGSVNGIITETSFGTEGFGYDPIFLPEGDTRTFAQMSLQEKNKFSHRSRAIQNLAGFLSGNDEEK
ncbi:MAG: RdgB/HAM1 family non-canonical purine NTP pyrophosphatase [Bacteroidetes bacterium]|nr:RdgB/HAM1 family non-canonical purine NTP pyrophosphatase [Bacteroidota bacterium]MBK9525412.1 RdgB/HAM1 family non-canonical purine NTP pyrophosphatase [Bacteroidota bacterium]MBP6402059.1 RdgB/HAM1 family non-canonical purine NTP pyrophosphatase [Bacteroidia bacterium]MBP6649820.1 RdgB/HAM1 family non-canonical purine NTP pyrophosphatase [Bacteroidia bacterium]